MPGRVIAKTQKMVLDSSLLNTQHYKVRIKGKVEQCRERSSAPLHLGVVAIEKGAFGSPSTMVTNFTYYESKVLQYSGMFVECISCDRNSSSQVKCCIPTIVMMITIQRYIHKCKRLFFFLGTNAFINFWLQFFDTRREAQFLKVFRNHTMLTPPTTSGTSRGI